MAKISIDIKKGALKKVSYIVGIDLGTTNSLVAYCNPEGGEPIALSQNNATIVPSIVFFDENDLPVVGEKAIEKLILSPERTIYSVKRLLGRSFADIHARQQKLHYKIIEGDTEDLVKIKVGNKFYSPIDLSAIILRELKQRAEKVLDAEISKAVITVPAYFNDSQRQATRDAGKMAGLDVLRIINEPTAASLAYGIGLDKSLNKTVAVYDFGGGTFDVSILRIEEGVFEVLSTHGDTFLGGDDFDQVLVSFWLKQLGISEEKFVANVKSAQHLRLLAEKAKKTLSSKAFFSEYIQTDFYSGELRISKDDFEKLITPIIAKTIDNCKQAIKDAGITIKEIDDVIMVGGSTRVPAVVKAVKAFFEKDVLNDSFNPDEVVALGAAIEADVLSGNRKDILLLDVTPLSLGIETLGGLMDFLINRNSKIPCKASRQYTTSKDGQTGININIYQGERELVSNNRKLGEFELKGIPAMPAGLPKIEVIFLLDADGILTVDATELRSGVKQEIRIKPAYGLTDSEVENMLLESLQNASTDMEQRMMVEAITEAKQLIDTTERFIEKNKMMLEVEEIDGTQILINELKNSMKFKDRNVILSNIEKLNEFSRPYAERVMDSAVSQSLKGNKIV